MMIEQQCRAVFQRLSRQLTQVRRTRSPESVHRFRTQIRRAETYLQFASGLPDRNTRKLMKLLGRLRKKAGKVRDLDVQTFCLRNLKAVPSQHKSRLLRSLFAEREKREAKFAKALDEDTIRELRKRLRRAVDRCATPEGWQPLPVALREFAHLAEQSAPLNPKTLHRYRIIGKQARYLAEMAGDDPEAVRVVEQLRRLQDVVGDWHDFLTLTERAEDLFGGVKDSPLVAVMHNLTRAKFRRGLDAVTETKAALSSQALTLVPPASAGGPSPGHAESSSAAVA
jgi:CHAD domain-containing protein